jgi:DNA-binding GntR family transcriptional regulator
MTLDLDPSKLEATTGHRQATMSYRVYQTLKRAIVELQLKPGHLLSEADVARRLGVSRQPVREAFIKLAEVGLVEVRPQRGTFVVLISRRDVTNARFIREAIEVAVVRKAAEEASAAAIAELADIVARQRVVARSNDNAGFFRLDEAFHLAIAASAACEHAWRVVEDLKAQMDRVRYLSVPDATPIDVLVEQHTAILKAIEAHDPDAAEKAMRVHLAEILKSLPRIAAAHAELFVD